MRITAALLASVLSTVCNPARADDLNAYRTYDCTFTTNTVTTIEKQKVETKTANKDFQVTFSGFDAKKGEAMLIGNAGSDRVFYFPGDKKIMLVQITDSGNGSMTSISEPRSGTSLAFHSRHMWLGGEPVVSHYYAGLCKVRG